jgi:D-alanyl-D-alanine dipeptidase
MALSGWVHLDSEWWHYNLPDAARYPLIDDGSQAPRFVDAPVA